MFHDCTRIKTSSLTIKPLVSWLNLQAPHPFFHHGSSCFITCSALPIMFASFSMMFPSVIIVYFHFSITCPSFFHVLGQSIWLQDHAWLVLHNILINSFMAFSRLDPEKPPWVARRLARRLCVRRRGLRREPHAAAAPRRPRADSGR